MENHNDKPTNDGKYVPMIVSGDQTPGVPRVDFLGNIRHQDIADIRDYQNDMVDGIVSLSRIERLSPQERAPLNTDGNQQCCEHIRTQEEQHLRIRQQESIELLNREFDWQKGKSDALRDQLRVPIKDFSVPKSFVRAKREMEARCQEFDAKYQEVQKFIKSQQQQFRKIMEEE